MPNRIKLAEKIIQWEQKPLGSMITTGSNIQSKLSTCLDKKTGNQLTLEFTYEEPSSSIETIDLSNDEDNSIVGWLDLENLIFKISSKTQGVPIVANPDMSYAFERDTYPYFKDITGLEKIDMSLVENARYMFAYFEAKELDLSSCNLSNVNNFDHCFYHMRYMVSITFKDKTFKSAENLSDLFYYCEKLHDININEWGFTDKVTNVSEMFDDCSALETIDLTELNPENITNVNEMFYNCEKLTEIKIAGNWSYNPNISNGRDVFKYCSNLPNYNSSNYSGAYFKDTSEGGYCNDIKSGVETILKTGEEIHALIRNMVGSYTDGDLTLEFTNKIAPKNAVTVDFSVNNDKSVIGWQEDKTILISNEAFGHPIIANANMDNAFSCDLNNLYFNNITGFNNLDMSRITSASEFLKRTAMLELSTEDWNLDSLTKFDYIFAFMYDVETINLSDGFFKNATSLDSVFYGCNDLKNINVDDWGFTDKITNVSSMFLSCTALESINLTQLKIDNITKADAMFSYCRVLSEIVILPDWTTNTNIVNAVGMFDDCTSLPNYLPDNETGAYAKDINDGGYCKIAEHSNKYVRLNTAYTNALASTSYLTVEKTEYETIDEATARQIASEKGTLKYIARANDENLSYLIAYIDSDGRSYATFLLAKDYEGVYLNPNCESTFYDHVYGEVDWDRIDMSKVTDMSYMFQSSRIPSVNISTLNCENFKSTNETARAFDGFRGVEIIGYDWTKYPTFNDGYMMFEDAVNLPNYDKNKKEGDMGKYIENGGYFVNPELAKNKYTLDRGYKINSKITTLKGYSNATTINFTYGLPDESIETVDISENQDNSIRMWADGENINVSANGLIYANVDSAGTFEKLVNIERINLNNYHVGDKNTDISRLFYCCFSLQTIVACKMDSQVSPDSNLIFDGCVKLVRFNCHETSLEYAYVTKPSTPNGDGYFGVKEDNTLTTIHLSSATELNEILKKHADKLTEIQFDMTYPGYGEDDSYSIDCGDEGTIDVQFYEEYTGDWSAYIHGGQADYGRIVFPKDCSRMFADLPNLKSIDFQNIIDTSEVNNMNYMFNNCESLTELDLRTFDVRNLMLSNGMFLNCEQLENIYVSYNWLDFAVLMFRATDMFTNCPKLTFDSSYPPKQFNGDRGGMGDLMTYKEGV